MDVDAAAAEDDEEAMLQQALLLSQQGGGGGGGGGASDAVMEDEEDMLDEAFHVEDNSRLGCQLHLRDDMEGMVIRLAPVG